MKQSEHKPDLILTTLDRGLRILDVLAGNEAGRGLTLTELSHVLDMNRSTLFRFLATLRVRGYLERDATTDRYRLGSQVLTLASSFLNNCDLRQIARPVLVDLCDQTQELVHLAMLDLNHGDVVTIERIEGKQPISLQTEIGARRPAYCTASGKAILAHLPAKDVEEILARGMPTYTARTITSPESMMRELAEIRECGFAVDDEERIEGVRCVAAPVFRYDGTVVGAVSIAAPALRLAREQFKQVGAEVSAAAATVSHHLGYSGPHQLASAGRAGSTPDRQDQDQDHRGG